MKRLLYVVIALAAFTCTCSQNALSGGGSSSEVVALSGTILSESGEPVKGAVVELIPAQYDPVKDTVTLRSAITDTAGSFDFAEIDSGNFNIVASSSARSQSALKTSIQINRENVEIPPMTLRAPGTIKVMLPNVSGGYVYIPGTSIFVYTPVNASFIMLDSVPTGGTPSIAYMSSVNSTAKIIRKEISTASGDTTIIYNPQWLHAKRLYLNTTATGADVAANMIDFPVLVRLTSSNFDFSQSTTAGADIRFTKSDTTYLSYEIEQWDSAHSLAAIWVKVDTVYGNSRTHYLTMYWGNPAAAEASDGSAVFDTGRGYVGVWHFGDTPAGSASIKDQTANRYHGTPIGNITAVNLVDGRIGKGLRFNGTTDVVSMGQGVKKGTPFTLASWVFISLSGNQRFIHDPNGYSLWYDNEYGGLRVEFRDKFTTWRGIPQDGGAVQPMTAEAWHYVTGTFDGSKARLYIDGVPASMSDSIAATLSPLTSTDSLVIGGAWQGEHTKGVIDEVRIQRVPCSDAWIKLSYMNQKVEDVLVIWQE